MKKTLTLRKETVRLITDQALQNAVGGTVNDSFYSCNASAGCFCTGGLCMSNGHCPIHIPDFPTDDSKCIC
jgi:hypothetical protein